MERLVRVDRPESRPFRFRDLTKGIAMTAGFRVGMAFGAAVLGASLIMVLDANLVASGQTKVILCHNPGPNQRTITVASSAVPAHLAQGDYLGPCIASPSR
jgi:hypothetical protein